jgi:acetoin utilization deacetylase AcuC-like enzyme
LSLLITDLHKLGIQRCGTNQPELRQKLIFDELKLYYPTVKPQMELTADIISQLGTHTDSYINFLQDCFSSFLHEPDDQYKHPLMNGLVPLTFCFDRSSKMLGEIIKNLPAYRQSGFFIDDMMTPIYENSWQVALQSANNGYCARNYFDQHQYMYLSNTYPGHHAKLASAGGYCFLNNAVICAQSLVRQYYQVRVTILDLDYHAGNGFHSQNSQIQTISIHADPTIDYPLYEGYLNTNTETDINIIFPKKATWESYNVCLDRALKHVKEFDPDIVIVAFGFDTYEKDTDASCNYGCALKLEDYTKIGQELSKLDQKIIISQEGGYYIEDGPQIVKNLLDGLCSQSISCIDRGIC